MSPYNWPWSSEVQAQSLKSKLRRWSSASELKGNNEDSGKVEPGGFDQTKLPLEGNPFFPSFKWVAHLADECKNHNNNKKWILKVQTKSDAHWKF